MNSTATEALMSMYTIFSFAAEKYHFHLFALDINKLYLLQIRQTCISGLYYMICNTFLINCCVQSALLAYSISLVQRSTDTKGMYV